MFRLIYSFFFLLTGWKVAKRVPKDLKRYVMIMAPHTSNWDFVYGMAARSIMRIDTKFVAKKELFRFPFGIFFRMMGGYPVDRSKSTNFVDAVAALFQDKKSFSICLTPEGTRSYSPKWKTGFYYIALKAQVPVLMVSFNYKTREVNVEPPFWPTGDKAKDFEYMKSVYRKIPGKFPEKGVR